ncbi:ComEA family DNA-binding protein [Streptacidiphilus jiangxiensis]|uniref:Helix-hairpin-helix motif-containing protein n=1 Tax=Streptacidiphilus jiangxiensis TaxID=235985 RepID=A0A1H7WNW4_STRJI|nr:helix-hairpin-helix domain-containing protein [Streptacidiphilus jiangxiensis]SEM23170.1 Helix-hairpin-helix motif-containing protein [Streptacidiphilus jiangxiensis]
MSPAGSVLWALLPLFTVGMGTAAVIGWAAWRLRSRAVAMLAGGAGVLTVVSLWLAQSPQNSARNSLAGGLIAVGLVGGGLVTTFALRRRLIGQVTQDPAVTAALDRRARRAQARALAERDPALARELGIGRPDLPHQYDDGGLADVNHAPAPVLAGLPGMTPEAADRIVAARGECGGFGSVAELEVWAELPAELAEELADRLVFLP